MDSVSEHFPEKELLTKAEISTDHLYDYLVALYCQLIWVPVSWTDCFILRVRGIKFSDTWRHEGVIVEFSRHGHHLYAVLDREWTDAGPTNDPSSAARAAHQPDPYSTASSTTTLSSDKEHSKKNVIEALSSKSLPAADRARIYQSEPRDPSWRYTFTLNFSPGLPIMIAVIAAKSITSCQPQYQVLTTNCFLFSVLFCELLKKYAVEQKVGFEEGMNQENAEEEVEQEGVEHQEVQRREQGEKKRSIEGYAKAGTFLKIKILTKASLEKYVAMTYPTFQQQVTLFKERVRF
ncbi:hypothetical protein C0992_004400 [Termitomyces sp. T32_za158]|nr:hypothetical protein C0992_004400 [Termitomyces sp. T32_za158]